MLDGNRQYRQGVATEPRNESERWFEQALDERGIAGGDVHQPDLGGAARPDYRIHRPTPWTRLHARRPESVICEVKGFTETGMSRRLSEAESTLVTDESGRQRRRVMPMMLSDRDVYGTTRNKIIEASKRQLRKYAGRREALAVVVVNPAGVHAPIYEIEDLIAVMYGDPGWAFKVNPETGEASKGGPVFGEDGVFGGGRHRYISAVIALQRRTHAADFRERRSAERRDDFASIEDRWERVAASARAAMEDPLWADAEDHFPGKYFNVRVVAAPGAITGEAVPVPTNLFTAPSDEYWALNPDTGGLERLR